jgi:hypothetical protein
MGQIGQDFFNASYIKMSRLQEVGFISLIDQPEESPPTTNTQILECRDSNLWFSGYQVTGHILPATWIESDTNIYTDLNIGIQNTNPQHMLSIGNSTQIDDSFGILTTANIVVSSPGIFTGDGTYITGVTPTPTVQTLTNDGDAINLTDRFTFLETGNSFNLENSTTLGTSKILINKTVGPLSNGTGANSTNLPIGSGEYITGSYTEGINVYVTTNLGNINKYDGSSWNQLSEQTNGSIDTMIADNIGNLYFAGQFTSSSTAGTVNKIMKQDLTSGTFSNVNGNGININFGRIYSLCEFDSNIYVGGIFSSLIDGTSARNIAKFNKNTGVWSNVSYNGVNGVNSQIGSMVVVNGKLYMAGTFTKFSNDTPVSKICSYSYSEGFAPLPGLSVDGNISEICSDQSGNIYIGGYFNQLSDTTSASKIAKFNTNTGVMSNVWDGGTIDGVDNTIYNVFFRDNKIYGTTLSEKFIDNTTCNRLAIFDTNSNTWSTVTAAEKFTVVAGAGIHSIGDTLYFVGNFSTVPSYKVATLSFSTTINGNIYVDGNLETSVTLSNVGNRIDPIWIGSGWAI